MAVPSYTEDLTDIDTNLAESVTGYVAYGGGAAGLGAGADFAMQGTNCIDKQITNAEKGILYNKGTGITMGTGDHTFIWHFTATPGVTDTLALRGAVVNIGNATTAFVKYHVEGKATFGAGGRVGKCYVVDQTVQTANTGSIPYRTLVGTPNGTLQYFGSGLNTTATVKSANMGLDATRYGTGAYITAGDVTTPATFAGFSTQSDAIANRWGILTDLGGSFELQGYFVVGQNNGGTATLAYFEDTDVTINIVDTVHSATDFTRFLFDHASTIAKWTNISITALGTNNKGYLEVLNTATQFDIVGGTFTGFGTTTLLAACSADGTTWRTSDQIILTGATLDNCLIDKSSSTSAVTTADLDDLTLNNFVGDGTGHAVELSSIGGGTMAWNNTFDTTTYATVDGSTGNEAIYVNVGSGSLTINVTAGATVPTIRTAGATITVVAGAVTLKVTATTDDGTPVQSALVLLRASDGTGPFPFQETVTITNSGTTATVTHTSHGMLSNDYAQIRAASLAANNGVWQITVINTNSYSYTMNSTPGANPTGTILSTFAALYGLTDVNGVISTSRVYSADQPVVGWSRKSTTAPFLKQGILTGEVLAASGYTSTGVMVSDQ